MRWLLAFSLALSLGVAGADAKPKFMRGGGGSAGGGGGLAQSCDPASSVCAQHQSGQTFVTWTDMEEGANGNNWRYTLRRSASPITSGNYSSATVIASYILNNSAQLVGGDPSAHSVATFTNLYRETSTRPRIKLSDLGTERLAFTGVQPYTALGSESAYYAVVAHACPSGVCPAGVNHYTAGGTETYIGSVGPIAESAGTITPIKWADSSRTSIGRIDIPTAGLPLVLDAHGSSANSGCITQKCTQGDYWQWFLDADEGWQDGRQAVNSIYLEKPSTTFKQNTLIIKTRDDIWNSLGTDSLETVHNGIIDRPNPLAGPENRRREIKLREYQRYLNFAISHYGVDPNQLHMMGSSMGGWGVGSTGILMTSPKFSSIWGTFPLFNISFLSGSYWRGLTWPSTTAPFYASGANLTSKNTVFMEDGVTTFGDYYDMTARLTANPGDDYPVIMWHTPKDDNPTLELTGPESFQHHVNFVAAMQTARRGHAFAWSMGNHDTYATLGALDCDNSSSTAGKCYPKSLFKLNQAYLAPSNSSIDDDPGTGTRDASFIMDGDPSGCINCGFTWNITTDTAGAFDFTVYNAWLGQPPTPVRQTTLTGTMPNATGTGSVTVTDGSVFPSISGSPYFVVGGTEIISVSSVVGNTVNYNARKVLNTAVSGHNPGETIRQYITVPTGPNAAPPGGFTTMTVDLALRRIQGGAWGSKTCSATPNGGSATPITPTMVDGIPVLVGVVINATGATSVACS